MSSANTPSNLHNASSHRKRPGVLAGPVLLAVLTKINLLVVGGDAPAFYALVPVGMGAVALLFGLTAFAGYVTSVELFPIVLILIGLTILPSRLGGEHAHQPAAS